MNIYKFSHIGEDGKKTVMLEGSDDLVFSRALIAAIREEKTQKRGVLAELLVDGKITQGQFDQLTGDPETVRVLAGQVSQSLEAAGYELIQSGNEKAIVKNRGTGRKELFARSEDHAGWGLKIHGMHYEFVKEHEESGEPDGC